MSSAKSFQRDLATSKELPFHTGLKLGATLNDKQKQIVKFNGEIQAFNPNPKFPLHFNPAMDKATEISEHGISW